MSKISITPADVSIALGRKKLLYDWIRKAIVSEKKMAAGIAIILCSDEYLLDINKKFLSHDYYTDIITFDYTEGKRISGELYISIDRVKENAKQLGVSFPNELHRVMIHGVLHLCGYKDKTRKDREMMRTKEDQKLKMLKL